MAVPMASAQYCPPGAATTCSKVLVLGTPSSAAWLADVQSTLRATGAFATVDTFDATSGRGSGTPSSAQLQAYDAVLAFSDYPFADASLLGDRLAAYHDQGGGVVIAHKANYASVRLQGVYGEVNSGYALMDYSTGGYIGPSDSLGVVEEPQSPLMAGVASIWAASAYRSTASVVAGRGVVVARWSNGGQEPLVLRGTKGTRTLVEINLYPVSSSIAWDFWSGDVGNLLKNGLKFSRCMPCGMGTYADAGEQRG
jgi:hypothetical protein